MVLKTSSGAPITCSDWDDLCDVDGFLALGRNRYPFSYVIYTDGTYFYAENGTTGNLDYGGPTNEGLVTGTDARDVIQACITALGAYNAGTIFIRRGTYLIDEAISLTGVYNLQIVGEGRGRWYNYLGGSAVEEGTLLKLSDGADDHLFEQIEAGPPARFTGLVIRDLFLKGNAANQTPGAASDLIHLAYVKQAIIERCNLYSARRYGVNLLNASENVWIARNEIRQDGDGSHCINMNTAVGTSIVDNMILGAVNAYGIYLQSSAHYNYMALNSITDCDTGVRLIECDYNRIVDNTIGDHASSGVTIYRDSHKNLVAGNDIRNTTTFRGIMITDDGTGATLNTITDNIIADHNTYGIEVLQNAADNYIYDNTFTGNVTAPINDAGSGTRLMTLKGDFPLSNVGGGAGTAAPVINTSPGGIDIDANDEFCYIHVTLPERLHQVVRIKLWAYSNVLEADAMRLRVVAHGATDNEAWSGNAIDVVDHPSESSNFVANDVVYWLVDAGDDAQIGTLAAQDLVELMAVGEAAGGADCATDALFGSWEIEYV